MRLLAALLLLLSAWMAEAASRPNVVIVLVDDAGYGDFGCHGHPFLKTPHIDRLHGESVRLTDFHVAPMCSPTRGQLLTGVHGLRNGVTSVTAGRTFLRPEFPTMPQMLAAGTGSCPHQRRLAGNLRRQLQPHSKRDRRSTRGAVASGRRSRR